MFISSLSPSAQFSITFVGADGRKEDIFSTDPQKRLFPFLMAPTFLYLTDISRGAPRKENNLKVKGLWKKNARDVSYVPSRGFLMSVLFPRLDNAYISSSIHRPHLIEGRLGKVKKMYSLCRPSTQGRNGGNLFVTSVLSSKKV